MNERMLRRDDATSHREEKSRPTTSMTTTTMSIHILFVVLLSELKRTSGFHEYWITMCVADTSEQEPQDVNVPREYGNFAYRFILFMLLPPSFSPLSLFSSGSRKCLYAFMYATRTMRFHYIFDRGLRRVGTTHPMIVLRPKFQ